MNRGERGNAYIPKSDQPDVLVPVSSGLVKADAEALEHLDALAKKFGQLTVLWLIPYRLRPGMASGVWQSLLCMLDEFKRLGINPEIYAGEGNEFANYQDGKSIRVRRNSTSYEGTFLLNKRKGQSVLRQSKPDVVVSEESLASTFNWTVIRGMPKDRQGNRPAPIVGHHHGRIESLDKTTKLLEFVAKKTGMIRTVGRSYSALTSPSYATKDFWDNMFGELIDGKEYLVIPNAIDLEELAPKGREKLWQDGRKTVVFMGRLEERKGVKTLMDAICRYMPREAFKHLKFKIGGEGPLKEQMLQMRQDAGLTDNEVEFIGFLNRDNTKPDADPRLMAKPDMLTVLESMDIGVASSNEGEGEGIWAKEICSTGKLGVITRIDGHNEVLNGANETFFRGIPPYSPQNMAGAILDLAQIPTDRAMDLGKEGIAHMQRYSVKTIVPRYVDLFVRHKDANDEKRKVQWQTRKGPKRYYRQAKVAFRRGYR